MMNRLRDWMDGTLLWLSDRLRGISGSTWKKVLLGLGVLLALYYPIGMILIHRVDDNIAFQPAAGQPGTPGASGGSASVAIVSALIEREIDQYGWVLNDPFFKPSSLLDNMPNYQQGMFAAFARFTIELRDQVGRTRGSSSVDPDLEEAAGLLPYPGDVWIFNFATSIFPTASTEKQYSRARSALVSFNRRLAAGDAVFDKRADNLLATLDRIALDIGSSSAALDTHISEHSGDFFDFQADNLFYNIKGQAYGYYMILTALRDDFSDIILGRELAGAYNQMLESLQQLALLDPIVVTNNEPGDLFPPNHLTDQGFYLLRARTQLREITNILLK